jgi:flagellar operon protein
MDDKFGYFPPPLAPPPLASRPKAAPAGGAGKASFDQLLDRQLGPRALQFSRHALARMESRGICFSPEELGRIEQAVQAAQSKGSRDSLVLLGGNALVVSVKHGTVVTVVDQQSLNGNVFTNIDSAVIA